VKHEGQPEPTRMAIVETKMTNDIDADLRRLAAGDHPGLLAIEESVIARIRERRCSDAAFGTPFIALAVLGAVAFGVTAGAIPAAPVLAAPLSPFGPSTPLAPSTLLMVDR